MSGGRLNLPKLQFAKSVSVFFIVAAGLSVDRFIDDSIYQVSNLQNYSADIFHNSKWLLRTCSSNIANAFLD